MKEKITQLPHWVITDLQPAFYDTESSTAVEQTGKVYAKVQELVDGFNSFIDEINKTITEFNTGVISDQEEFKTCITQTMHNYISMIDDKIKILDVEIANKVDEIINTAIDEGKIVIDSYYNEYTEDLSIIGGVR